MGRRDNRARPNYPRRAVLVSDAAWHARKPRWTLAFPVSKHGLVERAEQRVDPEEVRQALEAPEPGDFGTADELGKASGRFRARTDSRRRAGGPAWNRPWVPATIRHSSVGAGRREGASIATRWPSRNSHHGAHVAPRSVVGGRAARLRATSHWTMRSTRWSLPAVISLNSR